MAELAVYLVASAAVSGLVRRKTGNSFLALILFALLAFNPVLWHEELARVIREGLYTGLSLGVITLLVVISFPRPGTSRYGLLRKVMQGVGLGLLYAAFYLTREEGIWLAPAVAVVIAVAFLEAVRPELARPGWTPRSPEGIFPRVPSQLKAIVLPLTLASVVFGATDCLVATLNYRHYGVFETCEFRAKSFLRAYGALTRIQHNEWRRYVPFPEEVRQRAYAVSPAVRELAGSLEGPTGAAWQRISCNAMKIIPCSEVLAGWFVWEIRDAVGDAGHYRSAPEAMHFYDTLADQIDRACDIGTLACLPNRQTLAPPFRWEYVAEAVTSGKAAAKEVFELGDGQVGSGPSSGQAAAIAAFADNVGPVSPPDDMLRSVRGWAAAAGAPPTLQVLSNDTECQFSIRILPKPDVRAKYSVMEAVGFDMESPGCPVETGNILLEVPGRGQVLVPLAALAPGTVIETPTLRLFVESVTRASSVKLAIPVQAKIAAVVAKGYSMAFPVLVALGAIGLLLATFFRTKHPAPILALGLASAVAIGDRITLLAYIDASSFPAASVLYGSPASPFVIILTVIGIYLGYRTVFGFAASRQRTARVS
jgi:hypothetical protein